MDDILVAVGGAGRAELRALAERCAITGAPDVSAAARLAREDAAGLWIDLAAPGAREELGTLLDGSFLLEVTGNTVFHWQVARRRLELSPGFRRRFGYEPGKNNFGFKRLMALIHPGDRARVADLASRIRAGGNAGETDCRVRDCAGEFIWCRAYVRAAFEGGRLARVDGVLADIDRYCREAERLARQAGADSLTGLRGRASAENAARRYIAQGGARGRHALFIIDIDGFTRVNAAHGYHAGDAVLCAVAARLRELFRCDDIIGRAAGDVFTAFMKDVPDDAAVLMKARAAAGALSRPVDVPGVTLALSVSVGAGVCSACPPDFDTLWRTAFGALTEVKSGGGGGVLLRVAVPAGEGMNGRE